MEKAIMYQENEILLQTIRNKKNKKRLKQKIKIIEALEKGDMIFDALEIASCGDNFRVYQCKKCGVQPAFPVRCGHRLCPECQSIRSNKFIREHYEILKKLRYPKMLTLTFPSVKRIDKEYIKWARKCFMKFRRRKVMKGCWGGVYSFETTYSKSFGWHLHIHALIGSSYIPQDDISREWEKITGACVVDIRSIKPTKGFTRWDAIKEVLKYPTKVVTFIDDEDLVSEFLAATKRVNLAYGFGAMYHAAIKDEKKTICPMCGSEDIDWSNVFEVEKNRVREIQGGYIFMPP